MATAKTVQREIEKRVKETVNEYQITLNQRELELLIYLVGSTSGSPYQEDSRSLYHALIECDREAYIRFASKYVIGSHGMGNYIKLIEKENVS